jgi:hypothetical protein
LAHHWVAGSVNFQCAIVASRIATFTLRVAIRSFSGRPGRVGEQDDLRQSYPGVRPGKCIWIGSWLRLHYVSAEVKRGGNGSAVDHASELGSHAFSTVPLGGVLDVTNHGLVAVYYVRSYRIRLRHKLDYRMRNHPTHYG